MAEWDYSIFWEETMKLLREEVGEENWTIWLSNLGYLGASEDTVKISVPSAFFRDQFKPRYLPQLEEHLRELTGKALSIEFQVSPRKKTEGENPPPTPGLGTSPSSSQKPQGQTTALPPGTPGTGSTGTPKKKHPQLREDFTFDRYIIGENNSFAANAAIAIGKNPGTAYNPFLIYGGVGLGKTHLMEAIGNYIYETTDKRIIYITAENFLNEFVQATQENRMNIFKNKFRYTTDVLLIDDIHFFQGKDQTQEELFHTFNALLDAKKQLVFTCDRPPSELKNITERLKSRFEQCLKVDLQPPKYETRYAILKSIVENQHAAIPNEVIDLISKNVSSNVRDLISALNTLIAYQKLMGKPISLENAQQQLRDVFASPRQSNINIDVILKAVAEEYHLSPNDLRGKKRNKNIVTPRHIAMYLAKEITEYSTTEIGQDFGGRDHSTVITACRKIEAQVQTDPGMYSILETLKRKVKEYSVKS